MTQKEKIKKLAIEVVGWHMERLAYLDTAFVLQNKDGEWWVSSDGKSMALVKEWNPYRNITDAWMIVEKLVNINSYAGMPVQINSLDHLHQWQCNFYPGGRIFTASAGTCQEAICKAALKTIEVKQ